MKILGIHDGHNATAALMLDGQVAAMISEERLTYRKNEMGFPEKAINECLRIAGIQGSDLDVVALSTISIPIHYLRIKREFSFTIRDWLDEQEYYWKPLLFENRVNVEYLEEVLTDGRFAEEQNYRFNGVPLQLTPEQNRSYLDRIRAETLSRLYGISGDKIVSYDHHKCHQYYAYFASPFRNEPALVFTCDGGGDGVNGTVCIVENDNIKEIARNNCTDLARLYRYITLLLGMKIGEHEYKVMGLAPYASDYEIKKCDKVFKNIFHVPDLLIEYKNRPSDLFFYFREQLADCRFDGIAGGVQKLVEEVGREWFSAVTNKLNISRIVFAGGLSMNVKLNKHIGEIGSVQEFYCPPSAGDESTALGACYLAHRSVSDSPVASMRNNYLGPSFSSAEILEAVSKMKNCTVHRNIQNKDIVKLLVQDQVIGRFAGRMEFGARALGNRSIIANPGNPAIARKINKKIKFRDFWMPFAPSVLDLYVDRYLINPKRLMSDHMTLSFDVTEEGRKALIAAIHPSDYTARAHIVTRELNPGYYELIEAFAEETGVGAVLNTSFNLHGLPLVCSPEQAVHGFENSDLDAMVLEDILVIRER